MAIREERAFVALLEREAGAERVVLAFGEGHEVPRVALHLEEKLDALAGVTFFGRRHLQGVERRRDVQGMEDVHRQGEHRRSGGA